MYYQREISPKIEKLLAQFPAIILTGARQTGKTTLLKHLFPRHKYVSLDLPTTAEMAENEPQTFFDHYPPPVIILIRLLIGKGYQTTEGIKVINAITHQSWLG